MVSFDSFIFFYLTPIKLAIFGLLFLFIYYNKTSPYLIYWCSIIFFILLRLPIIFYRKELNPDESWLITGAITLSKYSLFYEYVNGDTSGPLNFYYISFLTKLLNIEPNYLTVRSIGLFNSILFLTFVYHSLKTFLSKTNSSLLLLTLAILYGSFDMTQLVFYNSENLPIVITSFLSYIVIRTYNLKTLSTYNLILFVSLSQLITLCKLQVIPIALFMNLFFIFVIIKENIDVKKTLLKYVLFNGIILFVLLLTLYYFGILDELILYYLKNNLQYSGHPSGSYFEAIDFIVHTEEGVLLIAFFVSILVLFALSIINKKLDVLNSFSLLLSLISFATILKTGFMFQHYLMFLLLPLSLNVSLIYSFICSIKFKYLNIEFSNIFLGGFLVIYLLLYSSINKYVNQNSDKYCDEISKQISISKKSNSTLSVWGTRGIYHIENQIPQGTPYNHVLLSLYQKKTREVVFNDYFQKMAKRNPTFFIVDYADPGYEYDGARTKLIKILTKKYTLKLKTKELAFYQIKGLQ